MANDPAPQRAHTIILQAGADSAADLAHELHHLADGILRGQVTVGCSGAPSGGTTYSYRVAPEQTHEKYFQDVEVWLAREREAKSQTP